MDYLYNIDGLINNAHIQNFLIFFGIFLLFLCSAYFGKLCFKRTGAEDKITDDEAKIILGAILSLLGLMTGFVLSISISGYDDRQLTEEKEVIAIGNAAKRVDLLNIESHDEINKLLKQYLDKRIDFFQTGVGRQSRELRLDAIKIQTKIWDIAKVEAIANPNPIHASVLASISDLYSSQQNTMASWRSQIPNAAWALLIVFGFSANIFIGFNVRGIRGNNVLMFILPTLLSLALFMISEIDIPGEGIINMPPHNLITLQQDFLL